VDDRFDRRELLLHLGDVLEAISCLANAGQPAAPVAELANSEDGRGLSPGLRHEARTSGDRAGLRRRRLSPWAI
jgi:hypothetical protein